MHTPHPNQVVNGKDDDGPKLDIPQRWVFHGGTDHSIAQDSSFGPRGDTGRVRAGLWGDLRGAHRAGNERKAVQDDGEEEEDGQDIGDPGGLGVFEGEEEEEAEGGPFVFGLCRGRREREGGRVISITHVRLSIPSFDHSPSSNPQITTRTYRTVVRLERGNARLDGPLGVPLLFSCLGDQFPHGAHAHGRGLG